ncbi:protein-disulfide reductase DsbD domain-containing protein, partial [Ramlibacter sp.]|uniref:protein-disulfide reductase DsbD domain-containing protein n=1 Tax=Ramlibacter sp. TaxID=1917967 RepID=UPI002C824570
MMSSAHRLAGPALAAARALLLAAAAIALLPAQAQVGAGSVVKTERVRAELMAHAPDGIAAGKQVWLGLQLTHQPEWHTYWKNPGDSGLPTSLEWTLPAGVTAGEIAWPVPRKIPIGHLANYGYEGTVLLPVPLTIAPDFKPSAGGELPVKLKVSWLVCRQECIPEDGEFALNVPARSTTALNGPAFQASFAARPQPIDGTSQVEIAGNAIKVKVAGLPAALRGKTLEFFPETAEIVEPAGRWSQGWQGDVWTAEVPLSGHRSATPRVLPIVLAAGDRGWRTEAKVSGAWPAAASAAGVSPALAAALRNAAAAPVEPTPAPVASLSLIAALLGALLGGVVLNLMPCVFP